MLMSSLSLLSSLSSSISTDSPFSLLLLASNYDGNNEAEGDMRKSPQESHIHKGWMKKITNAIFGLWHKKTDQSDLLDDSFTNLFDTANNNSGDCKGSASNSKMK